MIRKKLIQLLRETAGDTGAAISIETPPRLEYGDYASNLPLIIAKRIGKNPLEVGQEITKKISDPWIDDISVSLPGFLNFRLSNAFWQENLCTILGEGDAFGNQAGVSEKTQVEFISANPTGPLTLANGRGGFLGDVLSNVLESQGHSVEREYYVNDAGNQIRTLGLAVLASLSLVPDSEDYYHGDHIAAWGKDHLDTARNLENDPESLGRLVAEDFLKNMVQVSVAEKMKISFDRWTSEYDLHRSGLVERALGLFKEKGLVYESEGAQWLKTKELGDDKDRVLMTGDGFPTYLLADAGHYLETVERGFQKKILILGADHHGYVPRLQAVVKIVGLPASEVIVMQLVRLIEDGREVRMSKRRGIYVTIDELIDEVGTDAARYFFLEKNPETHVDFDLDLARKRSKENPVYYVQYAHARMSSLVKKGVVLPATFDAAHLAEVSERELLKKIVQLPDLLEDIATDYRVSRLVRYAYDLSHAFHLFYEKNRVLEAESGVKEARFALVLAAEIVLKKTLKLLGISAPSEM